MIFGPKALHSAFVDGDTKIGNQFSFGLRRALQQVVKKFANERCLVQHCDNNRNSHLIRAKPLFASTIRL